MAKTVAWENALLALLFNNAVAPGIGDAIGLLGSLIAGNLYISLHTADPTMIGSGSDQTAYETTYGGYIRFAVPRTTDGWTISELNGIYQAANNIVIQFPRCLNGDYIARYVGIGSALSGAGQLLYYGSVTPLEISVNITPTFNKNQILVGEQ